ncbi:hypothetical protein Tco_1263685 [Tanacetum coccineum]
MGIVNGTRTAVMASAVMRSEAEWNLASGAANQGVGAAADSWFASSTGFPKERRGLMSVLLIKGEMIGRRKPLSRIECRECGNRAVSVARVWNGDRRVLREACAAGVNSERESVYIHLRRKELRRERRRGTARRCGSGYSNGDTGQRINGGVPGGTDVRTHRQWMQESSREKVAVQNRRLLKKTDAAGGGLVDGKDGVEAEGGAYFP